MVTTINNFSMKKNNYNRFNTANQLNTHKEKVGNLISLLKATPW